MSTPATLPPRLAELAEEFEDVSPTERLQLLLELSNELPELPPHAARDSMQRVPECQSPLLLSVEVTDDRRVHLYFDAPPEAPTTRGLAAILHAGLNGEPVPTVLETPDDFYLHFGLAEAVSPLRLRGVAAMLARIKRTVRQAEAP
ncbi:MAG: SufE family protein [Actinomycetota bacterium]|jgi:cysteine desulfuration protein SufE|nr:SufE family protein [Actinomycetota bacterium]HZA16085.1 SufE family protein [Pseudonocardiaceae bacterium]